MAPRDDVATRVLSNGLRVIARADRRARLVAIDIRYGVGDAMDPPEQQGLARGVARMFQDGETRHLRRGEAMRITDAAGLGLAQRGVSVSLDATHVTSLVAAGGLEVALWLEAERMAFASGRLGIARYTNLATPLLENLGSIARSAVFGADHPYFVGASIAAADTLAPTPPSDWVRRWYTPANATLVVAGDLDPEPTVALVERYFGRIAGGMAPRLPEFHAAVTQPDVHVEAPIDAPNIEVVWRTPPYLSADDSELDVAARLLERRLIRELEERGHAEKVRVSHRGMQLGGVLTVFANVGEPRWESGTLEQIDEQVRRLGSGEFSDAELLLAKREALRAAAVERDSLTVKTTWDSESFSANGVPDYASEFFRRLGAVEARAVSGAIVRDLTPATRAVLHVTPKAGTPRGGVVRDEPRRQFRPPTLTPAPATDDAPFVHLPGKTHMDKAFVIRPVEISTPSGIRIRVITRSELPLVRFSVFAPWTTTPPAVTTMSTVPELLAVTTVDGMDLESRLAALGAESEFSGDVAGLSVAVTATPDAVADAIRLVITALREPSASKDAADALRRRLSLQARNLFPKSTLRRKSLQISDEVGPYTAAIPDVPTTTPFAPADIPQILRTAWRKSFSVDFVGAISSDSASRVVDDAARGPARLQPFRALSASDWARREFDLVQDERSRKTSLVYACLVPDKVDSRVAAMALPALMSGAFAAMRKGGPRSIWADSEAISGVRMDGATLFYLSYAVRDEPGAVEGSVRAVLDRAEALARSSPSDRPELPYDQLRTIEHGTDEWALSGFDSSAQELDLLYQLGSEQLTFLSTWAFNIPASEVRSVATHCFAPGALHVVGYGHVEDAARVLRERGYVAVPVSKAR